MERQKFVIAVAANKNDIYDEIVVPDEDGIRFAKENKYIFASNNARLEDDNGIQEIFNNIARKIHEPNFDFWVDYEEKKKRKKKKKKRRRRRKNKQEIRKKKNADVCVV